jgi:sugar diacid utilization regulator
MSDEPCWGASNNPKLSALQVLDTPQFIRIVTKAIKNNNGNVGDTADALNVHRNTLGRWLDKYPELKAEAVTAKTAAEWNRKHGESK